MRSESDSESLMALPKSCIKLLRRSSTFCPFQRALPGRFHTSLMQLKGHRFPEDNSAYTFDPRTNIPLIVQVWGCWNKLHFLIRSNRGWEAIVEAGRQVREARSPGRREACPFSLA